MTTISEYYAQRRTELGLMAIRFVIVYALAWLILDVSLIGAFTGFVLCDFGYWYYSNKVKQ